MYKTRERFQELYDSFKAKLVEQSLIENQLKDLEKMEMELTQEIEDGKKVQILFQEIAQKTQANVEDHISNLVTLALKSVSPDFPNFVVKFVIRRKQLEADLFFEKDGHLSNPLFSDGGGPKDISSFGLIIANWSMDKTRATIVLDEPFRQVSPDLQGNVSEMLDMLKKELDLQIIMVSHAEDINICADKTYNITQVNGESFLEEI